MYGQRDEKDNVLERVQYSIVSSKFAEEYPEIVVKLSHHQLIYSIIGLVVGIICIVGGIVLFIGGVVGSTSWTMKLLDAESSITDAAPGVVLFIVGLFVVVTTRYIFKMIK